ncbi:hypothetical protein EDB85DRAFT_2145430 [Lactarius pseudohatsudake]|nr:hypothetical protein EDB85DRAFT_2145430 [Lactarius pseudohatsudake]
MNVRKIVESYEQELSSTPTPPSPRPGYLRPHPRPRQPASHNTSFLVASNQRSMRPQRPPSLKLVAEEGPAVVLREWTNEHQVEPRPNGTRLSVLLTSDTGHTFGYPSIGSAKPLRASPTLESPDTPLIRPRSPSAPTSGLPSRLTLQRRANIRTRRQQQYSRVESALAASLRRPAEYERLFPQKPSSQYAVRQLEIRVNDAKARLAEVRELIQDEATDEAAHQALLRTRWMAERWIAATEAELSRAGPLVGNSVPLDAVQPPVRKTRRDANLAYFFAHSPTRTTAFSTHHKAPGPLDHHPRLISKRDVEPPQLRMWPLTSTLREPIKLKTFPSTPYDLRPQPSSPTLPPPSPPVSGQQQRRPDKLDLGSPEYEPTDTTASLDTPLDDSSLYSWPGFADIYVPPHLSDEELLAALSADMKEEPMPAYVTFLLDQLEAIGEGVSLPGLSRKGSTTLSAFEFISRPSIEVYEYPVLPRSRLLVRRSMRFRAPQTGSRFLSGLRPVREDPRPETSPRSPASPNQTYPRSSVLAKVRRSMMARGRE